ncbi:MAG: hypothetical protein HYV09_24480 [Deltaproteobacteria bacterium]|nr:hypothetical protein [Deltaproteobacteria bacterium]
MAARPWTVGSLVVILVACSHRDAPRAVAPTQSVAPTDAPPLFPGLGSHRREVTTRSREAQRYFDQGLILLYGFNHDEAIRSFRRAAEIDPQCAMAHWGVAIANGPHINFPMVPPDRAKAAHEALVRARATAAGATEVERGLIAALEKRHADPEPADRKALDGAYASAMRALWKAHPDDADVGALAAEAMMDLRPWDLWTPDGKAQPGTDEIVAVLEDVMAKSPAHPLANHLYIHVIEASPNPEKAAGAAERLRGLSPGVGHLVHMPTHIDVRTGRWEEAIASNRAAIEADRRYREKSPKQGFYAVYMAHNHHMLTFAAMMTAKSALSLQAIEAMVTGMPPEFVRDSPAIADGFVAMPFEVLLRFGKWDAALARPEPDARLPLARALRLYARGVAWAAKGDTERARAEQAAFLAAKSKVPADAAFGNNKASDLLSVAEHVLAGEILFREGKREQGVAELRTAVVYEDQLRYDEPPDWIQPVRHALGAALLKSGKAAQAEAVYRQDLARLPGNAWSLHGLSRSLRLQKKDAEAEAAEARLAKATAGADIELTSSCMCLPGI